MPQYYQLGLNILNLDTLTSLTLVRPGPNSSRFSINGAAEIEIPHPQHHNAHFGVQKLMDALEERMVERRRDEVERVAAGRMEEMMLDVGRKMDALWNMPGAPGYEEARRRFEGVVGEGAEEGG